MNRTLGCAAGALAVTSTNAAMGKRNGKKRLFMGFSRDAQKFTAYVNTNVLGSTVASFRTSPVFSTSKTPVGLCLVSSNQGFDSDWPAEACSLDAHVARLRPRSAGYGAAVFASPRAASEDWRRG